MALLNAENNSVYSMHHCRFSSFEVCAVIQLAAYRTAAQTLGLLVAKPLPCNTAASVHKPSANLHTTAIVLTLNFVASNIALCIKHNSETDLTTARPVSCALRVTLKCSVVTIAQINTRNSLWDAREYNSSCTSLNCYLILNHSSSLIY